MKREESYQKVFQLTKYTPLTITIAMICHCIALYFFHYDSFFIRYSFEGCLVSFATFMYLSNLFRFCWAHRLCIAYNCVMDFCCEAEKTHWFARVGIDVNHARVFMLVVGFIVLGIAIHRIASGTITMDRQ